MKEKGELESTGDTPLPVGGRNAWISIFWVRNGIERSHDFSSVQELGRFLNDQPELGELFGYNRK